MKRYLKLISGLLFGGMLMLSSCTEEETFYQSFDPAKDKADTKMLLSSPAITVQVNANAATTTCTLGVIVQGSLPTADVTIPIVIDSYDCPAGAFTVNGTGFLVQAGKNGGSLSITLNRDIFAVGVIYKIHYHLGTPSVAGTGINELGSAGVITTFNPGRLAPFVGSYTVSAASLTVPGGWDEEWDVSIELASADPKTKLAIKGLAGGSNVALIATVDVDAGTISIDPGQNLGDTYGYGNTIIYKGSYIAGTPKDGSPTSYLCVKTDKVVGTVNVATGQILINNFLEDQPDQGFVWDAFNLTFDKNGK